ncbi:MAG: hypothetical protein WCK59_00225 [Candidatus Falkowbacteria bacterium]
MNLIKHFFATLMISLSLFSVAPALAASSDTITDLDSTAKGVSAYQTQVGVDAKTTVTNKVGSIVALILSFVGIIFLILTIYAGLLWMTAQGNNAQVEKAKDLLINAVIGLVIVTAAYSITSFVGTQIVGK